MPNNQLPEHGTGHKRNFKFVVLSLCLLLRCGWDKYNTAFFIPGEIIIGKNLLITRAFLDPISGVDAILEPRLVSKAHIPFAKTAGQECKHLFCFPGK